ncbi:uncharacterized protein SAPINGB_P005688 [Magnusiomyces paraingens]|uniref:DUF202 domain-containing protein n=1 Tax=Magnusiomyces paraingens TaxID=2606893 RepID=A0A5E8C191_9ASCO|nr:uncharacterized protein SAPINGB_P005688 [Saprochaete ingens]VVT57423.1 unnamed protein product [Saprochaete ingens]
MADFQPDSINQMDQPQDLERYVDEESEDSGTTDEEEIENHTSVTIGERIINNTSNIPKIAWHPQNDISLNSDKTFFSSPFSKPLLLSNNFSEARDADAAERNFLSWLKVATYLSIAGTAVIINIRFHDRKNEGNTSLNKSGNAFLIGVMQSLSSSSITSQQNLLESVVEENDYNGHLFSLPLGFVFYSLSFLSILVSIVNYISTINGYFKQRVVVTNSFLTTLTIASISLVILTSNVIVLWKFY